LSENLTLKKGESPVKLLLKTPIRRFLVLTWAFASVFTLNNITAQAEILFFDNFDDGKIDARYEMKNHPGKWEEKNGVISQTNPTPGDHTYLIIAGDFEEPHTGLVQIRIDEWADGDLARAGIGFRHNPGDGSGYAFLIHHFLNNMEFLNDHLAWKQNDTQPPFGAVKVGEWYWMKAEISDDGLKGKIWPDGEKEPDKWLLESKLDFGGPRPPSGQVGLNGGSSTGAPAATVVSFDNFAVCDTPNACVPDALLAVEPAGKLSTTWGALKKRY
jgi:hypothetical protein